MALVIGTVTGANTITATIPVIILNSIGSGMKLSVQIGSPTISKVLPESQGVWMWNVRQFGHLFSLIHSNVDRFAHSWHGRVIEIISISLHHRSSIHVTIL
jgi:hypothetical protein